MPPLQIRLLRLNSLSPEFLRQSKHEGVKSYHLTQGERRYGKSIGWDFDIGDHLHGIPGPALWNEKTVNYGIAETTTLLILDRVTLLIFPTNSTG